ncbi:MAG: MFS transporter [Candidatus Lokiarchaeota archaeon]|nr:MFS transporter [Candidatus Lokiarchaeota archaeon]MBD3202605.1 MFS transporter [Candidatus Lokiarchaeota archaeon]
MGDNTKFTKILIFTAACIGWIHDAFNLTIITLIGNDIKLAFGVGNFELGLIFSGQFIATFFGAIFFGSIADRIGRKPALLFSILWDTIITTLSAFSPNFIWLFLTRIFSGMGVSWGVGYALIAEVFGKKPKRRGLAGGFLHSTFIIGFVLASVIAQLILPLTLPFGSWRYCFLFSLFPLPLLLIFQFKMKESEMMVEYKEEINKRGIQIRKVPLLNVFKKEKGTYLLIISAIMLWLSQLVYHNIIDFGPTFIEDFSGDPNLGQRMVTLVGIFGAIGIIGFGGLSDKIGRRISFFINIVIQLISVIIFLIANELLLLNMLILAYILFGFGQGNSGVQGVWLTEMFSTGERASTSSVIYSFARGFSLSGIIVGLASELLEDSLGLTATKALGWSMGLALFFCIPLLILPWLLPETKGKMLKSYEEEDIEVKD